MNDIGTLSVVGPGNVTRLQIEGRHADLAQIVMDAKGAGHIGSEDVEAAVAFVLAHPLARAA